MHDGAPTQFLLAFRKFLNIWNILEKWMGQRIPAAWSARSSDLKHLKV
jgi:hypothetical protein